MPNAHVRSVIVFWSDSRDET